MSERFINKTILTNLTMEIEITKITSKGQVVIPQRIRDKEKIIEGEHFFVYGNGDSIILKRTKRLEALENMKEFEKVFRSAWKTAKEKGVKKEDVAEEIKAVRKKEN